MPDDSNNPNTRVGAMAPDASTSAVDWSRPIEANDGSAATYTGQTEAGYYRVKWADRDGYSRDHWFDKYGKSNVDPSSIWVSNVQPTTPKLDPALWDRMVALVRDMATDEPRNYPALARAIVADLPKPVDPDLLLAREIAALTFERGDNVRAAEEARNGTYDGQNGLVSAALDGIRKGRQLATPEVSHVG